MSSRITYLLIAVTAITNLASAQTSAHTMRSNAPDAVRYLPGDWHCVGAFASGKRTAGNVTFHEVLNGAWLEQSQDDEPPGTYHSVALWGPEGIGGVVAYIADGRGGMRHFVANGGWSSNRIVLQRDSIAPSGFSERFTYARESEDILKITYEITRDSAATWRMGDTLSCARQQHASSPGSP